MLSYKTITEMVKHSLGTKTLEMDLKATTIKITEQAIKFFLKNDDCATFGEAISRTDFPSDMQDRVINYLSFIGIDLELTHLHNKNYKQYVCNQAREVLNSLLSQLDNELARRAGGRLW